MSELSKERVLVILALLLCVAVILLGAWDAPELSPIGVIYSDEKQALSISSPVTTGFIPTQTDNSTSEITTQTDVKTTHSHDESIQTAVPSGKTNINTASVEQLITLKGIGEVYAQRIIEYRESHGSFDSIEEIMNIKGIGEKRFADIKDFISVD
ncbi:MAG: helix-hairpin-helix domain-containing protein [Oscillospiraceae bacterium]|nr:helix-hairpin-helix domain-containing protein [Oscillospiraceae bacterium]